MSRYEPVGITRGHVMWPVLRAVYLNSMDRYETCRTPAYTTRYVPGTLVTQKIKWLPVDTDVSIWQDYIELMLTHPRVAALSSPRVRIPAALYPNLWVGM